jgi:hypothetical protein
MHEPLRRCGHLMPRSAEAKAATTDALHGGALDVTANSPRHETDSSKCSEEPWHQAAELVWKRCP